MAISKLVQTKTNSKHLIEYLDKVIKTLVLILPKMSGYVRTFKVKDGDKDKNNKLMSFLIDDEKLLEKYKTIWTKIEDLNIDLNALLVFDDRYVKTKIRTYSDKVYKMCQKIIKNENLLQSFLLILYLFTKTNISSKYI